jgi:transcriptional regulator with XRE-family HTH domain
VVSAELSGLTHSAISTIEQDKVSPAISTLQKLLKVYFCSVLMAGLTLSCSMVLMALCVNPDSSAARRCEGHHAEKRRR